MLDEEINSAGGLMTITAQTSVMIRLHELVNHPYASSWIVSLFWSECIREMNQNGLKKKKKKTRTDGQKDRKDIRTEG